MCAGAILVALAAIAWHFDVRPRHNALRAMPDVLRTVAATFVVFGVTGFGLVRLLLPTPLRRYELLWVLPTGACATGLTMTALGFAAVPYAFSLPAVLVAGLLLGFYAVRRRGWPTLELRRIGWPAFLAAVVLAVALVPMVFVLQYAAPVGTGSDAHVATGTAEFLKHSYPTHVNTSTPINRVPPTWRSKYPIYYAFAAVSSVSGLQTWQALPSLAAAMLAMAAIGLFLIARDVFGAPKAVALSAMGIAALDRMALHTVLNPYFNQTWGFFAFPFTLVLAWWVVQPGVAGRRGTVLLLAMFTLILAFAYPLAVPIPAVPIAVFWWMERRRRIAAGEHVFRLRDLYRGRRSLLWVVPAAALLAVPAYGVIEKAIGAAKVLLPGTSLSGSWSGDIGHFIPFNYFISLPNSLLGFVLFAAVLALATYGLIRAHPALRSGLGGLLVVGLLLAVYFRHRQFGWYFEFKLLAFIGPLLLLIAAIGAGRLRRWAAPVLAALAVATGAAVFTEIRHTGYQLPQATIQLSSWTRSLPPNASIRLDMWPPDQLWAAYFLVTRPLCSQAPLLLTDYAHVPISRKADYILAMIATGRPADAVGPPLRVNAGYRLYRENPAVPGPSFCSRMRQDRIFSGPGHSLK